MAAMANAIEIMPDIMPHTVPAVLELDADVIWLLPNVNLIGSVRILEPVHNNFH